MREDQAITTSILVINKATTLIAIILGTIHTTQLRILTTITVQIEHTPLFPLAINQLATITATTTTKLVHIRTQNGITTAHTLQVLTMPQDTTITIIKTRSEVILTLPTTMTATTILTIALNT